MCKSHIKGTLLAALLLCLLLAGCTQGILSETTEKPEIQVQYPPALEDGFAICCDLIDMKLSPASCAGEFNLNILSHEPLALEDISVQIDGLEKMELALRELSLDNYWTGQEEANKYDMTSYYAFLFYQDIDWEEIARIEAEIEKKTGKPNSELIAALDAIYKPYREAFIAAQGAFPQFYAYRLNVFLHDDTYFSDPTLGTGKILTDLLVTVKGKCVDLSDRFTLELITWQTAHYQPIPHEPYLYTVSCPVGMNIHVTPNGEFTTPAAINLKSEENITVTDINFMHCSTSRLISLEFTSQTTGINQKWDGKTPIEIAAGDTVELMFKAEDLTLADLIFGTIDRDLAIHYTAQGEEYTKIVNLHFDVRHDPYICYANVQDALVMERVRQPAE